MKTSFSCFVLVLLALNTFSQSKKESYSILFYNVENLFDVRNDSLTNDDEFTPKGERHWTNKRLTKKNQNISKAILNSSSWEMPIIIALCEIENRYVLEKLRKNTPLKAVPYKIIHKESYDSRGIDVALLYNSDNFYPIKYQYYPLLNPKGDTLDSREILYTSGIVDGVDTIHIFVNHWPSRYSGVLETRNDRRIAAKLLRQKITQLLEKNKNAKLVVIGDFNDQPKDESMLEHLQAQPIVSKPNNQSLYNLSMPWYKKGIGTIKFQSQWFIFDQIIVSGTLLRARKGLFCHPEWARISRQTFLLQKDERYGGVKPWRTYSGYRYQAGFSDHLPIILELGVN